MQADFIVAPGVDLVVVTALCLMVDVSERRDRAAEEEHNRSMMSSSSSGNMMSSTMSSSLS